MGSLGLGKIFTRYPVQLQMDSILGLSHSGRISVCRRSAVSLVVCARRPSPFDLLLALVRTFDRLTLFLQLSLQENQLKLD